ncbi:ribosome production factor 2 homolog [Formica exsecta]|uniref:ribosome production factor 2 homolog n=1 Tax=Formica exsecta TaxID=72781 RepID=UPI0011438CC0|nr:ribosome production factor 2 homolog [Formica exsecta]
MSVINKVKPVTPKGKRILSKKAPQMIEDAKETLCFKSKNTSQIAVNIMKDLYDLKKPNAQMMQKKNDILPFENIVPIEKFASKYEAPLFMMASHNKKRPHNLIMGRMYEHTLLDMIEFGIDNYKGLKDFKVEKITKGIKPLLIFNGELFESNYEYGRIKNLLVDMFQREVIKKISLKGLEHVLSFTAVENKIFLRSYRILLKKSNTRTPRVELEEIGPHADLLCRRNKFASEDLFKDACKKPKALKVKKKKNISTDTFGTTFGRIHIGEQNINNIQTRKMKGLKKTLLEKKSAQKRKNADDNDDISKKLKKVDD